MQDRQQKDALQATKEIVVKFIECGKISTASFAENFPRIYSVVLETIRREGAPTLNAENSEPKQKN